MKRKIISLGKSTLVVSLPAKWVKEQRITAGNEVEVSQSDSKLSISSSKTESTKMKKQIEIKDINLRALEKILDSLFVKGYDEITIICDVKKYYKTISKEIEELLGLQVVSQTKDCIVIEDLGGAGTQHFDQLVRRCFIIMKSVLEDLERMDGDYTVESFYDRDRNINRLSFLMLRKLNKELLNPTGEIHTDTITNRFSEALIIELLADDVARMGRAFTEFNKKDKEIGELFKKLKSMIEMATRLYFMYDQKDMQNITDLKYELRSKVNNLLKRLTDTKKIDVLYWIREVAETAPVLVHTIMFRCF